MLPYTVLAPLCYDDSDQVIRKGGVIIMSVNWITDADEALNQAKDQNKPLLIDFSAAPA
jgi:hypothetical protein